MTRADTLERIVCPIPLTMRACTGRIARVVADVLSEATKHAWMSVPLLNKTSKFFSVVSRTLARQAATCIDAVRGIHG